MEQTVSDYVRVRDIHYLLQKLVDKYDPLQVYCFHKDEQSKKVVGCFGEHKEAGHCDYWLLMVTEGISRIESAVQDFVNAHYDFGKVLIVAHGREGIIKATQDGYRFFANVYDRGELLYNRQFYAAVPASIPVTALPNLSLQNLKRSRQRYSEGISRAEGFLQGAVELITAKKYDVCAFMLHQAVEQCCIALIVLHMDYRCDIHNLYRLLTLCRCFSDVPYQLFITGREEDRLVFDKLVRSYCGARYGHGFEIGVGEIEVLVERVLGLVGFGRGL